GCSSNQPRTILNLHRELESSATYLQARSTYTAKPVSSIAAANRRANCTSKSTAAVTGSTTQSCATVRCTVGGRTGGTACTVICGRRFAIVGSAHKGLGTSCGSTFT